jgi:D-alanyl-lipoteichoic acid acyltransferase DltB (MBOAT superfamily)
LLVSFSWIFFRAESAGDAFYIVGHLFSQTSDFFSALFTARGFSENVLMGTPGGAATISILGIITLEIFDYIKQRKPGKFMPKSHISRLALFGALGAVLVTLGAFALPEQFIYFQF